MARALLTEDRRKSETEQNNNVELHDLLDEVTKRVVSLVEACHTQQTDQIQLLNSRVVSSIRTVLSESNIIHKDSSLLKLYPELDRQRKIILSALNRLVLQSKEEQQEEEQMAILGDYLLNEMDIFEKIVTSIPRQSTLTDRTSTTSSLFDNTPRSSISCYSSMTSISATSLRQYLDTRQQQQHTKPQVVLDQEGILQTMMDHQTCIDELMSELVVILERNISNYATDMLEVTRKAMESVMSFLSAVEQVCSNIGDLDYSRRISTIPEDPLLVTLVITKESVYSAITNLVTAVRGLAGQPTEMVKEDHDHLCSCCESVTKTTHECAACVKTFLILEKEEQINHIHLHMQDQKEFSIENHDLNTLERKLNTLTMIQQCLDEDNKEEIVESLEIAAPPTMDDTTAVDTIIPETNPVKQTKMRPRAASVNNNTSFPLLPPLPSQLRPSVSTTVHPSSQDFAKITPQRRSRGLSVSSLRSSIGKPKTDRMSNSHSAENLNTAEQTSKIHRLPSWMTIQTSAIENSNTLASTTKVRNNTHTYIYLN